MSPWIHSGIALIRTAHHEVPAVGVGVEEMRHARLLKLVEAGGCACPLPGFVECRQQHRRQNGDDRDYHCEYLSNMYYGVIL